MNKELKAISLLYPSLFVEGFDWDYALEDFDALPEGVQERLLSNKEFVISYLSVSIFLIVFVINFLIE